MSIARVDKADWIVVGHSHFDHLWGAGRIALQTGATIVGSFESILGHHDDWLPGVSVAVDTAPIRAAIAEASTSAELVEMGYCEGVGIFAGISSAAERH
jgi:glyoxylase-like metal-dependent hydrolase (beta-lactamase superfamily II)